MVKNLKDFLSDAEDEYSVDVHINELGISKYTIMYITVTRLNYSGDDDNTVVFNGLPYTKDLRDICGSDEEAAERVINTLKEDAIDYAIEHWNFEKDEWEEALDYVLKIYKKEEVAI